MARSEMTREEIASFLNEYRFAALTSLRKDGSPVTIPVGYLLEGDYLYFSIMNGRTFIPRAKNDPRVSVCIFNSEYPTKYVLLQGRVEIVDDPGHSISLAVNDRYMTVVPGLDVAAFQKRWLAKGRVVFRLKIENPITDDAGKNDPRTWKAKAGSATQ